MTRELIENYRRIVLPYMAKELLRIDYEDLGQDDAKEFTEHFNEILDLAIKALGQQPCDDCISRQAAIELAMQYCPDDDGRCSKADEDIRNLLDELEELPSAQPNHIVEVSKKVDADLISRADVEQTVEDNILCYTHSDRPIDQDPDTECHKAIRMALRMLRKDLRKLPSAQTEIEERKEESTQYVSKDDLISRQAAIDALDCISGVEEVLRSLPSAQPEITLESAVDYLHSIGWMQEHDRILTESAQPAPQWIPCSERLPDHPENNDYYLVTIQCEHYDGWDDYVTGFAEWTKHGWDELSCYIGQIKVIAWMPLPEPYKERWEDG